jgi:hypothetical protein
VEYVQEEPNRIEFLALRAVKPGDELTIHYGDEWWETRGLKPASQLSGADAPRDG